jgi:M6 family metalloprotease-like protein
LRVRLHAWSGALLGALALSLPTQPAAAQYVELAPRRGGVTAPVRDPYLRPGDDVRLGIARPEAFLRAAEGGALARLGPFPVLIIPALFSDTGAPTLQPAAIADALFRGPAPGGALVRFYDELSRGRLRMTGTVLPWVRTAVTLRQAAGLVDGHGWIGERMGDYVVQAVQAADSLVDFGQYDNDGPDGVPNSADDDGLVDAIAIEYMEVGGSCGGPGPWPHLSAISGGITTGDRRPNGQPVRVVRYISEGVTDCAGVQVQDAGTIAHELGHMLGLPDDYQSFGGTGHLYRRWNVGCWELMGGGSWGCGTGPKQVGYGPTHMGPLHQHTLGWLELDDIAPGTGDTEVTLQPVHTPPGRALRIPLSDDGAEYFLVEYRRRVGFDAVLPSEGVLVWHVDPFVGARLIPEGLPWVSPHHLVEADGDNALRKLEAEGGNRGVAADAFARDGRVDSLTDRTTPSTRDHFGRPTGVALRDIRVENGVARLRVTTRDGFAVVARASGPLQATVAHETTLRTAGGTPPFTVTPLAGSPLPTGLSVTTNGSTIRVAGAPLRAGLQLAGLEVRDAAGRTLTEWLSLPVLDLTIANPVLLDAVLQPSSTGITPVARTYLDSSGNRNGTLDLGDVRAYLKRTGRI